MAMKTLRLLRDTTSGKPRNKSVMSSTGCTMRLWMATRMPAPKSKLLLRRLAISCAVEAKLRKAWPPEELLERHVADDETLVRPQPVGGVAGGDHHRLARQQQRRLLGQVLRFLHAVEEVSAGPALAAAGL